MNCQSKIQIDCRYNYYYIRNYLFQRFYRHYELKEKKETQTQKHNNHGKKESTPYLKVFKQAFMQLYNIFFVFFVTLSIFPAVHAGKFVWDSESVCSIGVYVLDIKAVDENFILPEKYFQSVTCFLTFNLFAALGNYLTTFVKWVSQCTTVVSKNSNNVLLSILL